MELEESSIFFSSRKITNVKQFSGQKEPFDKMSLLFGFRTLASWCFFFSFLIGFILTQRSLHLGALPGG